MSKMKNTETRQQDRIGHCNGWAYDPAEQAWTAKVGPARWLIVAGDLDDPPTWRPTTPEADALMARVEAHVNQFAPADPFDAIPEGI